MADVRIEVYPVGLLSDIKNHKVRQGLRFLRSWIREGNWRAARNHFNGYLAEPCPFPPGVRRCGSGWTQARALRDLHRRMRRAHG